MKEDNTRGQTGLSTADSAQERIALKADNTPGQTVLKAENTIEHRRDYRQTIQKTNVTQELTKVRTYNTFERRHRVQTKPWSDIH